MTRIVDTRPTTDPEHPGEQGAPEGASDDLITREVGVPTVGGEEDPQWLTVAEPVALTRLEDPRREDDVDAQARPFILRVLLVALLGVAIVTGFNWYVDPLGEVRTGGVTSRVDARIKLDLIDAWDEAPDVLVLGSSTMMKYDPADFERLADRTAFNAGLTGAQPTVANAIAQYVASRHGEDMPNLVIGVSHFSFHSGQSAWIRQDARTRGVLDPEPLRERIKPYTGLMSLKLMSSSVKVLRGRRSAGNDDEAAGVDGRASDYQQVADNGFLLREYPDDPATVQRITSNHVGRYGRTFTRWVEAGGALSAEQRTALEDVIRLANEHGHVPVVVLTQLNPEARRQLAGTGLEEQEAAVTAFMEELGERVDFTLLDMRRAEAFDADVDDFYDATHMSSEAAARIIERIARTAKL